MPYGLCRLCMRGHNARTDDDFVCDKCIRARLVHEAARAIEQSCDKVLMLEMLGGGFDKFLVVVRKYMSEFAGLTFTRDDVRRIYNYLLTRPFYIPDLSHTPESEATPAGRDVVETESVRHGRGGYEVH